MSQTFLTDNPPMILDATCSFSKIWPAHATLRIDFRAVVGPDIVADDKVLPFRDATFDEIYCDPPHMIRSGGGIPWNRQHDIEFLKRMAARRRLSGRMSPDEFNRYWWFRDREEMNDYFEQTLKEFFRILKPSGILHFKLTESTKDRRYVKMDDFRKHSPQFETIKDIITPSKSNFPNTNRVHWLIMKPRVEVLVAEIHNQPSKNP